MVVPVVVPVVVVVVVVVVGVVWTVVVVVGVEVVAFVLALVAAEVGQDSVTEEIGGWTGSGIDDRGVPGGTSTVNWSFWPPATVTYTTHCWADAVGSQAIVIAQAKAPADATTSISFRLLSTLAFLLLRAPA